MSIRSVLIIDDDPTQVAILNAYFASLKASEIIGMTKPCEALAYISENQDKLDLVVCDLQMPEIDGLEFLRHLASKNYTGKLAIVSGVKKDLLSHASQLAKMHNLNFIGDVAKPVTKSALDNVFLKETAILVESKKQEKIFITQNDYATAIRNNEVEPFYQPKIDVNTGKIVGAEALVRWNKANVGFISPEVLISFAEDNGLIEELTFYLFNMTVQSAKLFLEVDCTQVFATNLVPIMANNLSLPDQLSRRIHDQGMQAKNFSFEVTENNLLKLDVTTLEVLSRLRILGFNVAIDDFGTGSSNIQTLRDFPYSELKIDRTFVSNVTSNIFSQETVRAAVSLSHERGMKIVAEGVEDVKTFEFIKAQGIDHAQGYLFSKALSHSDYLTFIKEHKNGFDINSIPSAA